MTDVVYNWRGAFSNAEVNTLHADAFAHRLFDDDWQTLVDAHSLGWVTARRQDRLIGFVNVIWDGLTHAWLQDTIVASDARRHGVGAQLVKTAEEAARAAGCEWLHVDFDDDLTSFYFDACGFVPTNGGLIELQAATD